MPRDLFAATLEKRRGPRRSKWTIAGSVVAHAVVLSAVLVLPILSAFDSYVVHARDVAFLMPPAPVMPAMPAAPPKTAARPVPNTNPEAAPLTSPQNPVTEEPDRVGTGGPPSLDVPIGSGPPGIPGGSDRPGSTVIVPPPPRPSQPVRPGGNISPPARLVYVDPVYPSLAILSKTQGMVILEATIDESGVVRDVKVLRGNPLLDQAAIDAVRKWRYTPTKLNGIAVPILLTVTVTFTLR